ncbi:MAG: hypothetical protein E6R13_05285 [Spirochaetes bacterium]|nr:MAG: hypothetical protein E6R13_05285 [Spirochaetota bacterium]
MANKSVDKKYHYLYKTTNLINNKYYCGIHSTNNLNDNYLGSGKRLRYSIRKYGKDNFKREIIKMFDNREDLVLAEQEIITEQVLRDPLNMNCMYGGESFNTIGMVTVKDKEGNTFNVFCDDPRYLSGELEYHLKNTVTVKDKNNNTLRVHINDPRYLSGELVSNMCNIIRVKDKDGNIITTQINDPRYLSGELIGITYKKVVVKDKDDNILQVDINDPRYLTGELKHIWKDRKHTKETKEKIGKINSIKQKGENNSQYGTCWITKDGQNKKIKKEELDQYINIGWSKGRNYIVL